MYNECQRQFSLRKLIRGCRGTERDLLRPDLLTARLEKTVSGTVFAQKECNPNPDQAWRRGVGPAVLREVPRGLSEGILDSFFLQPKSKNI